MEELDILEEKKLKLKTNIINMIIRLDGTVKKEILRPISYMNFVTTAQLSKELLKQVDNIASKGVEELDKIIKMTKRPAIIYPKNFQCLLKEVFGWEIAQVYAFSCECNTAYLSLMEIKENNKK